jgi:tryptophan-rich sensory protein
MFFFLALLLVVVWAICFVAFHILGAAIHILLAVAVVMLIVHFLRHRRTA